MRTDGIRVAIRPRGTLECLDLAVMFCGRRPLAVGIAAMVGALPCILLNRAVVAVAGDGALVLTGLLLGIETAWAAVPLTLYLGQSVFSDRFSIRDALRAGAGGLPAMIVFQGLLRTVCLAIWVLAPVVFVGMYYLDQIILLERPAFLQVWARRTTMNRGNVARVLKLACVDALLLAGGTVLGIRLLAAVAGLWHGRGLGWETVVGAEGSVAAAVVSWHGQIAFWATCGFLTVFRFFTYLDARIRREGWDVELRFRADETYAGVQVRRIDSGARATVVAAVLTVVVAATASLAAAADGGGRPAPESRAREALSRQAFPWYDSAGDRFRPLIRPSEGADDDRAGEPAPAGTGRRGSNAGQARTRSPWPEPVPSPLSAETLGVIAKVTMIGLLVAVVAALIWVLVRHGLRDEPADDDAIPHDLAPADDAAESLPASLGLAGGDLLGDAAAHADRGDFAAAMLRLHAWMLVELDRRGGLALARGKTNGQYRAEVAATLPAVAGLFAASSRLFEDAFFGRLPIDRDDFLAVWERRGIVTAPATPVAITP
jgi:hypothetical protein